MQAMAGAELRGLAHQMQADGRFAGAFKGTDVLAWLGSHRPDQAAGKSARKALAHSLIEQGLLVPLDAKRGSTKLRKAGLYVWSQNADGPPHTPRSRTDTVRYQGQEALRERSSFEVVGQGGQLAGKLRLTVTSSDLVFEHAKGGGEPVARLPLAGLRSYGQSRDTLMIDAGRPCGAFAGKHAFKTRPRAGIQAAIARQIQQGPRASPGNPLNRTTQQTQRRKAGDAVYLEPVPVSPRPGPGLSSPRSDATLQRVRLASSSLGVNPFVRQRIRTLDSPHPGPVAAARPRADSVASEYEYSEIEEGEYLNEAEAPC